MCSQVILAYASHLARTQSTLDLVPAFLCHLRLPDRRELVNTMLSTALAAGVDEPYVREINGQLCLWLLGGGGGGGGSCGRQQACGRPVVPQKEGSCSPLVA